MFSTDIVEVALDDRGFIAALELKHRGRFPVQFVVDCSGFAGLILREALQEPFVSYQESLPCDRALALQVPHDADTGINPFTLSAALGAGWSWTVPSIRAGVWVMCIPARSNRTTTQFVSSSISSGRRHATKPRPSSE